MSKICPAIGGAFSENKAYDYLNRSVAAFPSGKNFEAELVKAGFLGNPVYPIKPLVLHQSILPRNRCREIKINDSVIYEYVSP